MPHKDSKSRCEYNKRYYNEKRKAKGDGVEPILEMVELPPMPEESLVDDDHYIFLKTKSKIKKGYEDWSYYIARVNAELLRKKAMWGRLFW